MGEGIKDRVKALKKEYW